MNGAENGVREERSRWPEAVTPGVLRWTEDEFDALIETGAAARLGRIELRGGEIWRMNSQYAPHMRMKLALWRALDADLAGRGLEVGAEVTVRYPGFMPTPDVVVFDAKGQMSAIPGADVRLIVEVSDTTLSDDLGDKRARYAAAGLTEYWVVDLGGRRILRFDTPTADGFRAAEVIAAGDRCACLTLPDAGVDTAALP